MKRLLLLFIPLMFFFGCEDDSPNTSYNCTNDECFSADGGSGQYATLNDCLSVCGNNNVNNDYDYPEFCLEIDITCDINARYKVTTNSEIEWFYLTGENTSATIEPDCEEEWISPYNYEIEFVDMDAAGGCADIEVRVFKDDVLFVTNNYTLGCIEVDFSTTGTTYCNVYCSTNGNTVEEEVAW